MFQLIVDIAAGAIIVHASAFGPWATATECKEAADKTVSYGRMFTDKITATCLPIKGGDNGKSVQ